VTRETANLTCPFCLNQCIHAEPGKTRCPICDAVFEIDDRVECVFEDTDNIRLTVNGIVCGSCGLVQGVTEKVVCTAGRDQHGSALKVQNGKKQYHQIGLSGPIISRSQTVDTSN
jgi:hypothetical protein